MVLVAAVGVVIAVRWPHSPGPALTRVSGLIGSEKTEFFNSPEVQQALRNDKLDVHVTSSGSWQMAQQVAAKPTAYDFAFPASSTATSSLKDLNSVPVRPFYSPLVVIANRSTVDLLLRDSWNGVAGPMGKVPPLLKSGQDGAELLDMDAYRQAVAANLTWGAVDPQGTRKDLRGQLLISTTDPASSSSAALYLAVMSYLANGQQVVTDQSGIDRVGPLLKQLVQSQGALLASSDELFRDFLSGVGRPLIWTYESEAAGLARAGKLPQDTVVLYPDTTIQSDHTVVELTKNAEPFAAAMQNDPVLRQLAARFGFRPSGDPQAMVQALGERGTGFAADVTRIGSFQVAPPSTDNLQKLVNAAKGSN
ncbi:hypothetical protein GCM10009665_13920 [Kitasatospora nipponensis]|uniref:Extracellular solute-binding protein n=1 Tax=Kitasatospora nipponensis TaxID=258049 RepID=A0ABN1VVJ8_9ACTN